jgi:hypothetical protein
MIFPADKRASRDQILRFKHAEGKASNLFQLLDTYLLD